MNFFAISGDGEKDCPDNDDELAPLCQNVTCRADQFQCADKACIHGRFHCSGKAECKDGSDELNCRKHYCRIRRIFRLNFCIHSRC